MSMSSPLSGFTYPPINPQLLRSGCCLTSAGAQQIQPEEPYPGSGHPSDYDFSWKHGRKLSDFALVLISEGQGEWEAHTYQEVSRGDIFFLVPGQWHRYRPSRDTGWTEKWAGLSGYIPHGMVASGHLPNQNSCLNSAITPQLEARFDRLVAKVLATPGVNAVSWGSRALALMLEAFEPHSPQQAPDALATETELALRFIRENCHRPIGVPDVAQALGLDRRALERRFNKAGLPSIGQCIMSERVERAELLLNESQIPLKEIAYICGFRTPQRMIYNFQQLRGSPPSQYRSKHPT